MAWLSVSVVVCTYRRSSPLRNCLWSLRRQQNQPCEIVVIDNNPENAQTCKTVRQYGPKRFVKSAIGFYGKLGTIGRLLKGKSYPAGLSLVEFAGGAAALPGYWLHRLLQQHEHLPQ